MQVKVVAARDGSHFASMAQTKDHGGPAIGLRRHEPESDRRGAVERGAPAQWEMVMYGQGRELEIGNAASAILVSLLKTLVDKNVLSNPDVRAVLTKAANDLGPHDYTAPVKGAIGIILDDLLPLFPEDGGD